MQTAMFWVTLLASLGAIISAGVAFLLYRLNVDPHVIVYAVGDRRQATVILLVIENIGKGVARDVRFDTDGPLPWKAWGMENAPRPAAMEKGPLVTGIPSLEPGARREITWGQFGGLHAALGSRVVRVQVSYSGDGSNPFAPARFLSESLLEVKSLEHTNAAPDDYSKVTSDQLKKLADAVSAIADGRRKLSVELERSDGVDS